VSKNDDKILFLPLGGSGEIGMNLNLYGYKDQWLMVDLGITFHDRLGIEVILPNPQYIAERKDKLVGLLLTHAHEDHIGAVPYLWERFKCPIYATPFTAEMVKIKMKDHNLPYKDIINIIPLEGHKQIGPFDIQMVTLTHSIPEPNGVLIKTPVGTIFHTGDWKIDETPLIGNPIDGNELQKIGDAGVLAMVCDSTNVFQKKPAGSEGTVRDSLIELIGEHSAKGSIFVTCFASNLARLETIAVAAHQHGRQVAILGRGFHKVNEVARKLNYLKDLPAFIDVDKAKSLPRDKVLYICSGSQGEFRAALGRIASQTHPEVKMAPGDLVVFSSRIIPGNDKQINAMKNKIIRLGVQVINEHPTDIHVSGHPSRDELIQMYDWIRPRIVIPVHGEAIHMVEQGRLAKKHGIKHVVIPENGTLIEITKDSAEIVDEVAAGRLALDGNMLLSFNHGSLKERFQLGTDGVASVVLVLNDKNNLGDIPKIAFQGLSVSGDLATAIHEEIEMLFHILSDSERLKDDVLTDRVQKIVQRVCQKTIFKKPMVITHVVRI
jgi:ribonuclease J